MKYLNINLLRHIEGLCAKNGNTMMKEIEIELNSGVTYHLQGLEDSLYRFNSLQIDKEI